MTPLSLQIELNYRYFIFELRLVEELTSLGDDDVSLVLHLILAQPVQACERLIRRTIFKHEHAHKIMSLFVRQILRINDKNQFKETFLNFLTSSFLVEKDPERYAQLPPFLNLKAGDRPVVTLLGETQHFYDLLIFKAIDDPEKPSEEELVKGGFKAILEAHSAAFGVPICQGDFIQSSAYQKLLLVLQWDLGSDGYVRNRVRNALLYYSLLEIFILHTYCISTNP